MDGDCKSRRGRPHCDVIGWLHKSSSGARMPDGLFSDQNPNFGVESFWVHFMAILVLFSPFGVFDLPLVH
jgi:hypothetical protein